MALRSILWKDGGLAAWHHDPRSKDLGTEPDCYHTQLSSGVWGTSRRPRRYRFLIAGLLAIFRSCTAPSSTNIDGLALEGMDFAWPRHAPWRVLMDEVATPKAEESHLKPKNHTWSRRITPPVRTTDNYYYSFPNRIIIISIPLVRTTDNYYYSFPNRIIIISIPLVRTTDIIIIIIFRFFDGFQLNCLDDFLLGFLKVFNFDGLLLGFLRAFHLAASMAFSLAS